MVKAGTFSLGGMQPPVRLNALLHKGLFHETLPQFLSASPPEERVSWVNLDMDLYQGALDVLRALTPRMRGGGSMRNGTLLHFHELVHATEDKARGDEPRHQAQPAEATPELTGWRAREGEHGMDEARALFDWMHHGGAVEPTSHLMMRSMPTAPPAMNHGKPATSCISLELVPRQWRPRDQAAAFFVV